jgi:heat shock protein HslJ
MRALCAGLALLVAGGCSFSEAESIPAQLLGEWELVAPDLEGRNAQTLAVEESMAGGYAGCNYYGASVRAAGGQSGRIRIEVGGMTRIWCGETIMRAEARYTQLLGLAQRYSVTEETLTLTGPGPVTLHFQRSSAE